ncbi:hypothetical protein OAD49_04460 [Flavobacteriaceae bacterium]|nr:hypothetical protein [Flavobacteriaceae bacterium]
MAIWHFFYESILATSLRHGLRYDFFKLRDRLRNIKIDNSLSKKDEEIFKILDDSISQMINSMSFISAVNYIILRKQIDNNTSIKSGIEKVRTLINTADNKDLISVDEEINSLGSRALIINNGGWILYLAIPLFILFLVAFFTVQLDKIKSIIKNATSSLIYSSDSDNNTQLA